MAAILLLEDEPIIARNITRALSRDGHTVRHAPSAAVARHLLTQPDCDLVLADISLGDGDGIDVLGEHAAVLGDRPIVVMTGQDNVENRLRAEGLSVSAFLAKPFAMARMAELVGALVADCRTAGNGSAAAASRRGPSVMMYSHDTIGLGHMRRNTAIAHELVARVPGVSVLMLVGCPAGMIFEPRPGIDYVKLPSLAKLARGRWQASNLRIDADTTRALRSGIIERVVETFRPDVFLVDHEPAGVWDELVAPLTALRADGSTRTVLGLRDILDDPDRTRGAWAAAGIDGVISSLYDDVLIYGNAAFYPSATAYGLERLLPGKTRYCGAVTTAQSRPRDGWTGPPRRVLVSGGGGRDAFLLLDTAIAALTSLPRDRRPQMTIVAGPLMDGELRAALAAHAETAGAIFHEQVPDMPERLAQSDLFITMGGYNSVTEALATGCPALVVPRVGPSGEQRIRAERLQALGLADVIWRHDLTPARIATRLLSRSRPQPVRGLSLNGAAVAAERIATMLADPAPQPNPEVTFHA